MDAVALAERVNAGRARIRDDLCRLVRIPSVAFDGFPREPVLEAAALVESLLRDAGAAEVRRVEVPDDPPAVLARFGPAAGPRVLLYAHYDVQPAPPAGWSAGPFEPVARDGRLYGRGAADDKSGIAAHLAALRAWDGAPPAGVTVLVEGAEETGRQRLLDVVARDPSLTRADVIVVCDVGSWTLGEPAITESLRGHGKLVVEVRTARAALHSGGFGGAAPDALLALVRMLASLHDGDGGVAVPGLGPRRWQGTDVDEEGFADAAGLLPGVRLLGTGTVGDRLWASHAVSVLGIDAPSVEEGGNVVIPVARAKLGVRVPPGADPEASMVAVRDHLEAHAPWGAHVSFDVLPASTPVLLRGDGPGARAAVAALETAYGRPVARIGSGGSVPLVARLAALHPDADIVLWGAQDRESAGIHGPDESVSLEEVERIALAQAILIGALAA